MIKNIIFDFDGVLVDSEILVAKAFAKYMQNFGIDIDEKEFASFAGKKTVQVIDILSKKYSIKDQEKFFTDIMEIASNIYKKELTTVKGAYDFVSNLKLNMFIGSNSMKERIIDGLQRVKLDKYFKPEQVYSFDLVDNPKPDPDVYLKALEDNNLIKTETIIIEDSAVGVMAGVAANVKVIGLTAGGHWHEKRDEKELLEAGAFAVTNDYKKVFKLIESN
jgi:HAD superfamily hydrolase (TIGR01509 family)|tara:strand:- start:1505 stop:2164 length:660 start_codon:yes stop_codon:yes gene_type:complete